MGGEEEEEEDEGGSDLPYIMAAASPLPTDPGLDSARPGLARLASPRPPDPGRAVTHIPHPQAGGHAAPAVPGRLR